MKVGFLAEISLESYRKIDWAANVVGTGYPRSDTG